MPRAFTTGVGGSVAVGATTICVVEWSISEDATKIDTTNTCDNGYGSFIDGPINVTGSVKSYFDTNNNLFTTPTISIGAAITLVLNVGNTGKAWTVPARVDKISMVNNVKGVVTYDFDFTYNPAGGSIIPPS